MSEFRKRKKSEYAEAVATAERETKFFVATHLKATVPHFRVKLAQDISELNLAWRDMNDEQKKILIAETIRKAKLFVRDSVVRWTAPLAPGYGRDVSAERTREIDALYRTMSPEEREQYERRKMA